MTFKDLQVGDKFRFGPREAVVCIKTEAVSSLHKDAGMAKLDVAHPTNEWPVWDEEEVIQII